MKALNRIIASAGIATVAATSQVLAAQASAVTTVSMTGGFVAGTTAQPNGSATTELVSRTITSADLGATVKMRITPDSTSKLDCNSLVLRYRVGTQTTSLTRDWTQSGCWTGGANLVTKVTSAMVGSQVVLDAKASATAATGAMNYTGQSTVGSQVLSTKYSVARAVAPTNAPTASATPTAATSTTATSPASDAKPAAVTMTQYVPTGTAGYWAYRNATDPTDKKLFYQIGMTPSAMWFDGVSSTDDSRLANLLSKAKAAGQSAQFVLYGIPHRDCGSLSAGGQKDAASYKAWIDRVSAMVGNQAVTVIVEPDAISYCGSTTVRAETAPLMTYVGKTFHDKNPNAALYLHAGSAQLGLADASSAVRDAGIKYMRGFAMNVSSSGTTAVEEAWAEKFVAQLAKDGVPNMHYVVDTSRNGVAVAAGSNPGGKFLNCNNPTAAPGTRPTSKTTGAHADAYLWTKPIGESDGVCHTGDPATGQWFPQLARTVVQNGLTAHTIEEWKLPA